MGASLKDILATIEYNRQNDFLPALANAAQSLSGAYAKAKGTPLEQSKANYYNAAAKYYLNNKGKIAPAAEDDRKLWGDAFNQALKMYGGSAMTGVDPDRMAQVLQTAKTIFGNYKSGNYGNIDNLVASIGATPPAMALPAQEENEGGNWFNKTLLGGFINSLKSKKENDPLGIL